MFRAFTSGPETPPRSPGRHRTCLYSSQAMRKPLSVIGAEQSMSAAGNCYENATMEAFFSTLKTECFPDNQLFSSRVQARREIFEYIELYYNNQRLHSALGYRTPCLYETQFERVIDIEINQAQGLDAATEDRALRGRTSSADAALQTAGVVAYGRPTGPTAATCRSKSKAKNPRGVRGTESPDTVKKTENYVSVFSEEVHFSQPVS